MHKMTPVKPELIHPSYAFQSIHSAKNLNCFIFLLWLLRCLFECCDFERSQKWQHCVNWNPFQLLEISSHCPRAFILRAYSNSQTLTLVYKTSHFVEPFNRLLSKFRRRSSIPTKFLQWSQHQTVNGFYNLFSITSITKQLDSSIFEPDACARRISSFIAWSSLPPLQNYSLSKPIWRRSIAMHNKIWIVSTFNDISFRFLHLILNVLADYIKHSWQLNQFIHDLITWENSKF